jgi:hypothetical protein
MTAPHLDYSPLINGYSFKIDKGVKQAKLDGGFLNAAKDIKNNSIIVNCSFLLNVDDYIDFIDFYTNTINSGSLVFSMYLTLDYPCERLHNCLIFINNIEFLTKLFKVDCEIEALDNPRDAELDDCFMNIYPCIQGTNAERLFNTLEQFVNYDIPSILP